MSYYQHLRERTFLSISSPKGKPTDTVGKTPTRKEKLTQKSLDILWAAVIWPVSILQMPHRPFLPRQKVLDLQACGCIATGICSELCGDLELAIGSWAVLWTQFGPVSVALSSSALLNHTHKGKIRNKLWEGSSYPLNLKISEDRGKCE